MARARFARYDPRLPPRRKTKQQAAPAPVFVPDPSDAAHVRRAFDDNAKAPKDGTVLTPEQLRHWAETGEWPGSSD